MPSISPENFPYSVLEAFALGKPVIASRIGGIPEMVEDNHTGILVPPGDPAVLAEKIAYLVRNPALTLEMGRNARRRVETDFDAAGHYRKIRQVYDEIRA
jgi:glycosyltransferase involved in cell wall biosynthesis